MHENFSVEYLDHVAIRVRDLSKSAEWYKNVFGFEKKQFAEWGEYPIFLVGKKKNFGIALFPVTKNVSEVTTEFRCMDHFAFHVTKENFYKAKNKYESLGLDYEIQDHHYFLSIYVKDIDGHIIELIRQKNKSLFSFKMRRPFIQKSIHSFLSIFSIKTSTK